MRLMAHREREGGGGARKIERTQHSSGPREKQTIIVMHQFDCGGCRDSNSLAADGAPRERQETRERSEKREREYITSRITRNNSIDQ